MILKKSKPTSPGRRHLVKNICLFTKKKKEKNLIFHLKKSCGRNNNGHITMRHIGGGHKKMYRLIDFTRKFNTFPGIIKSIEYDPYRNSHICLVQYRNGIKKYIIAPNNIKIGDVIYNCKHDYVSVGSSLSLKNIPVGTHIHNVELTPGGGGKIARSAGTYCQILSMDLKYANLRLKSGEIRKVLNTCNATIGEVGNSTHNLISLGKAGASRWRNIRPTVRGTAMNPVDHPHGGGEGKNFGKHPVSPWGLCAKGKKTRNNKRTNKFIINRKKKRD